MLTFTGERIVPQADNCEPQFARKMYQEHIARYLFAAQFCQGRQVLDVGCGVGYGSQLLARRGAGHVTAFDVSADAVKHARGNYAHENVDFRVESADAFQIGRTFDVVTCFELIEHVDAQDEVLRRIAAHLSDDGMLLISTPRALAQKRSSFHTREFSLEEFRAALAKHFEHLTFFFENNHFASLVTAGPPSVLDRIELIAEPPLALEHADYFICVASRKPLGPERVQSQLVINDDAYVQLLERDVDILHRAENESQARERACRARQAELEQQLAAQATVEQSLRQELAVQAARLEQHMKDAETRDERQRERLDQMLEQRESLFDRLGALTRELAAARADVELFRQRAEAAERHIHSLENSHTWRYGEPFRAGKRTLKHVVGQGRERLKQVKSLLGERATVLAPVVAAVSRRTESPAPGASSPVAAGAVPFESDVVFVIGCHDGESKRYRVYNVADALQGMGVRTLVLSDAQLPEMLARGVKARSVVLFRAAWSDELGRFIEAARAAGARVFFDVDDLVFEPESIDNVRVVQTFKPAERAAYLDGVQRYRRTLLACDAAICPTEFLRQRIEALGKPAHVLVNTVNRRQRELAKRLSRRQWSQGMPVRIGYFSGSNTHQVDFRACEPALLRIMEAHPEVRFVLVGILDLGPAWTRFSARVERVPFQPYEQMMETLASVDINLAPLEVGNPYCESKSQLKVFEAGLVGVPTVASRTRSFADAVEHGVDGFLATSESEWFDSLEALVKDAERRHTVGEQAKHRALSQFSQEALAPVARETLVGGPQALEKPARTGKARTLKVSWVVPGLPLGSGGHRNILRVAYHLQRFGHDLELYFTDTQDSGAALAQRVKEHFYPLDCPTHRYDGRIGATDIIFATHWSTVEVALRHKSAAEHLAYFVQDFEPLFYPMGSEYILAENTYRQGLYHITSGPWCAHLLREQYGVPAEHFVFPIDRDVYFPRPRAEGGPRVLFFARPEMPRRCYDIGLRMLQSLHAKMPEAEIHLYGSRELAQHTFPFPAKVHALLPTIQDLAQLYSNSDVGVAFSTTNPSLVPYEMMASGLPVVDLHRPGNEINYGGRTDIAMLADPIPERMAEQVAGLLRDPAERARRSQAGIELVRSFPNEEQMARRVEELLLKLYR